MTSSYIDYDLRDDGIVVVTLNNPPLNLNTLGTLEALIAVCRRVAADTRARVMVITGAGSKAFCAGSDVKEFTAVLGDVVNRKLARENEAFTAIENLPIPVIAALNGVTLGGGAEIALACDIRIMNESARIGFPEIKLGVFPGSGGVFRLPRLVGTASAFELLYLGDLVDAAEAYRIGLVNRVVAAGDVLETALALAATIASRPALALGLIRSGVRDALTQTTTEATRRTLADSQTVFTGPDIEEGISAFFAKRSPVFNSRRAVPAPGLPAGAAS